MDRRSFLQSLGGATVVGTAAALAGCSTGSATGGDHDVGMTTRKFRPATITVPPGYTVVWNNTSSHSHTVTAYEGQLPDGVEFWSTGDFDSQAEAESGWTDGLKGGLAQGETYERTFETVGTHDYYCIPHEASGMRGKVVVSEDATTPE